VSCCLGLLASCSRASAHAGTDSGFEDCHCAGRSRRVRERGRIARGLDKVWPVKLRVTPQARRHLEAIAEYLTERSPAASRFVGQRIRETMQLMADIPMIGHEGAMQGAREMVVPGLPYIIVHRVEPTEAAVCHSRGLAQRNADAVGEHGAAHRPAMSAQHLNEIEQALRARHGTEGLGSKLLYQAARIWQQQELGSCLSSPLLLVNGLQLVTVEVNHIGRVICGAILRSQSRCPAICTAGDECCGMKCVHRLAAWCVEGQMKSRSWGNHLLRLGE
jgi:toxin ParE1/3/4